MECILESSMESILESSMESILKKSTQEQAQFFPIVAFQG